MIFQRSILGSVVALCALAVAAQTGDGAWTLAAVAIDVDAAVFADANGELRKVAVGARVPGDAWRLSAIRDGRAVLSAEQRHEGRVVELRLAVGERLPPPVAPTAYESQPPRAGANSGTR